jgi:hypothetical protein
MPADGGHEVIRVARLETWDKVIRANGWVFGPGDSTASARPTDTLSGIVTT